MLQINHLSIHHKKDLTDLVRDLSYSLRPGDKTVLIGEEGNGKSTPRELADISNALGLPLDFCYSDQHVGTLSGGVCIKAQFARILLGHPTVLLLDEPSNDEEYDKKMAKYRQIEAKVEHQQDAVSRQDPSGGRLLKKKMHAVKSMGRRFEREKDDMTERPDTEQARPHCFGTLQMRCVREPTFGPPTCHKATRICSMGQKTRWSFCHGPASRRKPHASAPGWAA